MGITNPNPKPPLGSLLDWSDVLSQGLALQLMVNEGSGAVLNDLTLSNPCTLINGPTWATGLNGPALTFNGASSQYGTIADSPRLAFNNEYTIFVRFRMTGAGYLVTKYGNPTGFQGFILGVGTGAANVLSLFDGGGWRVGNTAVNDNVMHTAIVILRARTSIEFWLDGQLDATVAADASTTTNQPMEIGRRRDSSEYLTGTIDGVRFYPKAIGTDKIAHLFENPFSNVWQEENGLIPTAPAGPPKFSVESLGLHPFSPFTPLGG